MKLIALTLLFVACFAPLSSPAADDCAASAQAVPICAVLADAAKYNEKEITVSAVYRMVLHGSILIGSDCPKLDVDLRGAPNWKGDKRALAIVRSLTKKKPIPTR